MKKLNSILVTGCGGDIGTGIARILADLKIAGSVVGVDISLDTAGQFVFDAVDVAPRADAPDYFEKLETLLKKYSVDVVIPMSEAEIRLWYRSGKTDSVAGIPVIMPNSESLDHGIDKLKTSTLLDSLGLQHPWTLLVKDGVPQEFPCIIKNRGLGGKGGVDVVDDEKAAGYFGAKRQDDMWQEYLEGPEYTAGVYGCGDGQVRTIIMKRRLSNGNSGFTVAGEVVDDQEIAQMLTTLARALSLRGSINVQLRKTKKGPMIFEINPRFSSTVVFRHKMGFQDVLWSIEEKFGKLPSAYTPVKPGTQFYKGYTEYIKTA